jgi:hypothetical protein
MVVDILVTILPLLGVISLKLFQGKHGDFKVALRVREATERGGIK